MKRRTLACMSLLLVAMLLADGRIVRGGFTGWDDPHTIVENPSFNPPSIVNTMRYWDWRHPAAGLYAPLTYTVWSGLATLSRTLYDGSIVAWPFHLASLVAHGAASVLVFLILRRLLEGSDAPACIGAMLFAVHPLQVEAVAWASGLKDVLGGALALAAMHQYLVFAASERRRAAAIAYGIALICFILAQLAKSSAAMLLPMLATIDLFLLRRPVRRIVVALLPWAILTLPLLSVARRAQQTQGIAWLPIPQRLLVAGDALAFYLYKLFAPLRLGLDYGRTPAVVLDSRAALSTSILPVVAVLAIVVARTRWLAVAGLLFVFGLLMNLGLAPFQFQFYSTVADHYVYLAMLGPALAAAWVVWRVRGERARLVTYVVSGVGISALIVLSFRQAGVWKDSVALFTHAIQVNDDSAGAHNNLGRALAERGDWQAAQEQFIITLQKAPYDASARRNLALIALKYGDLDAAIANLAKSIDLNEQAGEPIPVGDYRELARLLLHRRRAPEALNVIQRGLAVDPRDPQLLRMLDETKSAPETR